MIESGGNSAHAGNYWGCFAGWYSCGGCLCAQLWAEDFRDGCFHCARAGADDDCRCPDRVLAPDTRLVAEVYKAFGETEEATIYDTLAGVTHHEALEYLYLESVGAMAGGGLEEADQTIHEIKLLNTQASRDGANLNIDATWQVIGTVGHAEHLHVRGNTYSADLTIAPIEGAWRITDFELLEVSRDMAGETFLAPDVN
ncbi:MAG: hypothetical protein AAFU41_04550 [Pseudomonadota bacterium]